MTRYAFGIELTDEQASTLDEMDDQYAAHDLYIEEDPMVDEQEQCSECKRIGYHATFCAELDFTPRRYI